MSDSAAPGAPAPTGLSRLVTVARTGSTNSDLLSALAAQHDWPHLSALRAVRQSAGRGRAGRSWVTPDEGALTVSVVLRPLVPASRLPWLPLVAGLAVRDALTEVLVAEGSAWQVRTKWPNDVLLLPASQTPVEDVPGWGRGRKVCGLLAEVAQPPRCAPAAAPAGRDEAAAVVLGIGVNVSQGADALPVPWAGSLALAGAHLAPEDLLAPIGSALAARTAQWEHDGGLPAPVLLDELRAACLTLGQDVRVELPGGKAMEGRAVDLEPGLVVETPGGERLVVAAGDVSHLRCGPTHQPD